MAKKSQFVDHETANHPLLEDGPTAAEWPIIGRALANDRGRDGKCSRSELEEIGRWPKDNSRSTAKIP
jgi:hypothetical protein